MSTNLQTIKGTNGETESELAVTVFCGHSNLLEKGQPTRRCVQITVKGEGGIGYAHLTYLGIEHLIEQLQAVQKGDYEVFAD